VDELTGCWNWTGRKFENGYSLFNLKLPDGRWRNRYAHRVSYEFFVGPVPEGLELDHLCNNKICVSPEHLEPVTSAENNRRKVARQTHCYRGHPLSGDNLYTYVRGGTITRHCRTCRRIADRSHTERRQKAVT
jgi:hypothetical protein